MLASAGEYFRKCGAKFFYNLQIW